MILPFDRAGGLVIVPVRVFGPRGEFQTIVRFAIDTGSTTSVFDWEQAIDLGYNPAAVRNLVQTTTASGTIFAPRIMLQKLEAFGHEKQRFGVLCQSLSATTGVDGLLGLDFFQGHKLTLDFRIGLVTLE